MILLCDEQVGTGVPLSLELVGYETHAIVRLGWGGKPDVEWLKLVGPTGWLVFSYNRKMLLVPNERDAIINEKVGILFLTNGTEHPRKVLRLILAKWDALDLIDRTTPRPFARFLSPNGRLSNRFKHYRL